MDDRLPSQYPISDISPYQILGVQESDSTGQITATYHTMVKMLHPDRGLTIEARRLGWTDEEKNVAYMAVQDAYKTIMNERKVQKNMPDFNIDYEVPGNFVNNMHEQLDPKNFDSSAFNNFFEQEKENHIKNGFQDPFSRGYSMFGNTEEHDLIRKGQSRPDVSVTINPERVPHKMNNNGALIKYNYMENNINFNSGIPSMEIGVANVEDFTVNIGSGLTGTDLMSVYGQNNEYWEDSVKKDSKLYSRFTDDTKVEKKMNSYLNERSAFNYSEIDDEINAEIQRQLDNEKRLEQIRKIQVQKEDEYYQSRYIGNIPSR